MLHPLQTNQKATFVNITLQRQTIQMPVTNSITYYISKVSTLCLKKSCFLYLW